MSRPPEVVTFIVLLFSLSGVLILDRRHFVYSHHVMYYIWVGLYTTVFYTDAVFRFLCVAYVGVFGKNFLLALKEKGKKEPKQLDTVKNP